MRKLIGSFLPLLSSPQNMQLNVKAMLLRGGNRGGEKWSSFGYFL